MRPGMPYGSAKWRLSSIKSMCSEGGLAVELIVAALTSVVIFFKEIHLIMWPELSANPYLRYVDRSCSSPCFPSGGNQHLYIIPTKGIAPIIRLIREAYTPQKAMLTPALDSHPIRDKHLQWCISDTLLILHVISWLHRAVRHENLLVRWGYHQMETTNFGRWRKTSQIPAWSGCSLIIIFTKRVGEWEWW